MIDYQSSDWAIIEQQLYITQSFYNRITKQQQIITTYDHNKVGFMEKKLFAIKMPGIEKEAMDFTASATGMTLTHLYYKGVKNTLYEMLGAVLLQKLDPRAELVTPMLEGGTTMHHIPPVVHEFIEIMDGGEKEEFKKIFYNVKSIEKEDIFQEFNVYDITRFLGKKYLDNHGDFGTISYDLVHELLFDYMLHMYYTLSVVGSMKMLEQEWGRSHLKVARFKNHLLSVYEKKYGSLLAPVKVEYENPKPKASNK